MLSVHVRLCTGCLLISFTGACRDLKPDSRMRDDLVHNRVP